MRKTELMKERDVMIVGLARAGRTADEVAYEFNLSVRRIMEILEQNGIKGVREPAETAKQVKKVRSQK